MSTIRALRVAVPLVALFLACAPHPAEVRTAASPGVSFERYHTFLFDSPQGAPKGYTANERSVEVQRKMTPLISAALTQKGYTETKEGADLAVAHGVGKREAEETHRAPRSFRAGGTDEWERSFVEGILVIDVYDAKTNEVVWHGVATGEVNESGIDEKRLASVVSKVMADFPPTRPAQ